jgi:DNA repair protein RadC
MQAWTGLNSRVQGSRLKELCRRLSWSAPTMVEIKVVRERRRGYSPRRPLQSAREVFEAFRSHFEPLDREQFVTVILDGRNQVVGFNVVSTGTLTSSLVHPREVFKAAILANAAAIILVHNHPSGDPDPSDEDKALTRRLKEAGDLIGIRVLDHVVIGDGRYVSLAELNLL